MEDERQEILDYLNSIRDPRKDKNKKHKLIDMLVLTICGVICGADDWVKLEHFARCKEEWFKTFLELPNGIPPTTPSEGCLQDYAPMNSASVF